MKSARILVAATAVSLTFCVMAQPRGQANPQNIDQEANAQKQQQPASDDPFADVNPAPPAQTAPHTSQRSWFGRFFGDNFGFRKEVMSQFDTNENGELASRQSVGFEILKKFSTETSTVASFDFQGRFVRRDGFNPVLNDMEGARRQGWAFEYHNLYVDFYNVFDPLLSDKQRGENVGHFNFRAGRFYTPFGLNLQTDTHGTVLQLSNERNFGFERDWYSGFWGTLNKNLNYDAYYMAGSGYDLQFKGQTGLGALRISLSNKYSSEYGLEGGVSLIGGERLWSDMYQTQGVGMNSGSKPVVIDTERTGLDARYRRAVPNGLLTLTSEVSGGRDQSKAVTMQLHQAEYLHSSRRWGLATQYRRYEQQGLGTDSSMIGEFTWYFRNDVGNSNLHWIKLNIEHQISAIQRRPDTVITLQYYFYR